MNVCYKDNRRRLAFICLYLLPSHLIQNPIFICALKHQQLIRHVQSQSNSLSAMSTVNTEDTHSPLTPTAALQGNLLKAHYDKIQPQNQLLKQKLNWWINMLYKLRLQLSLCVLSDAGFGCCREAWEAVESVMISP